MRSDRARHDPRLAATLLICSVGGLALAVEEAPAPDRSNSPALVTGSPATTQPSRSRVERGDSPLFQNPLPAANVPPDIGVKELLTTQQKCNRHQQQEQRAIGNVPCRARKIGRSQLRGRSLIE